MNKFFFVCLSALCVSKLYAQKLPDCDIWIVDVKATLDGAVELSNPVNITEREGYDNQPSFTADNKGILYTSERNGQTDIYKYDIATKSFTQLTNTPSESEYSPGVMPDGVNISIVKVEKDSAQRMWKFPLAGGEQSLIMKDVDSIGYYSWINKDSVAMFILGTPPTLQITDIHSQKPYLVRKNIGRGLQMYQPNNCLFFISYDSTNGEKKGIYVYCYGPRPGMAFYHPLVGANDQFCVSHVGLMMGEESIVYREFRDYSNPWVELSNLNNWGIRKISRIAISPDGKKAAVVSVN